MMWKSGERECRAGDVIVTRSNDGYLLFRVLSELAFGPWWELAGAESTSHDALRRARSISGEGASRVMWFEDGCLREVN